MALSPPSTARPSTAAERQQRQQGAAASALARAQRRLRLAWAAAAVLALLAGREQLALRGAAQWDARILALREDPEAARGLLRQALAQVGPAAAGASATPPQAAPQAAPDAAPEAASGAGPAASAAPARPEWLDAAVPLEWRFAEAQVLAAAGEHEAALARYRSLVDDPRLGLAARYNSSNVLMQQALRLRESPSPGQAVPVIELAKESYRQVLRLDPSHWPARYNYERAQRLLPDPEHEDSEAAGPPENAERAATTMRGVSQGLP